MIDRERARERDFYETEMAFQKSLHERSMNGQVLVRGRDLPQQKTRQGLLRYYLRRSGETETALKDWVVFVHEIYTHSGKHRHQGGLVIYVLDGMGYTVVDGVRYDWEAGDVILLPVQPGGCEHQHFNRSEDRPARWLALIYKPLHDEVASVLEQREDAPAAGQSNGWRGKAR